MSAVCSSCRAAIVWGRTREGQPMPLDATPHLGGSVFLSERGGARVLTADERDRAVKAEVATYTPHWATCPKAERHRVSRDQLGLELDGAA